MKRLTLVGVVLLSAVSLLAQGPAPAQGGLTQAQINARAKIQGVAEIPYESTPNFLKLPTGLYLADSYHCSRYNTNTGRLTTPMFHDVFRKIRTVLS